MKRVKDDFLLWMIVVGVAVLIFILIFHMITPRKQGFTSFWYDPYYFNKYLYQPSYMTLPTTSSNKKKLLYILQGHYN